MPTVLGCPRETHARQPCELLEYTGEQRCTSLPLPVEGMIDRETVSVLVYNMGPGEHSQNGRLPHKRGNGSDRNIPLVDTYLRLFSQRHPKTVNTYCEKLGI
jgi:hypothetical protein